MTIETPLLTAFVAAAGAVLIAVIGLIASVHYRLGKLEEGQKTLAQEDSHTQEIVVKEDAHTREMLTHEITNAQKTIVEGDAHTREMLTQEITNAQKTIVEGDAHTREMLTQEITNTRKMVTEGDAQTREIISQNREAATQENAHTRELLSQLIVREATSLRERSDAQHAETMSAIQRLTDAFLSHSHNTDGAIQSRIPPPNQQPARTDDEP